MAKRVTVKSRSCGVQAQCGLVNSAPESGDLFRAGTNDLLGCGMLQMAHEARQEAFMDGLP